MMACMSMVHLKELLVAKGKTQSELAAALGRDKSAITNLLHGRRQLKAQEIPVIATFLGVSEAQVLGTEPLNGLAEPERIPFQGAPSVAMLRSGQLVEEQGRFFVTDALNATGSCYALEVRDHSLDLHGIIPGDLVICNPSRAPQPDDIVVVQLYQDDDTAQTLLRKYHPPFLEIHSTRDGFERLHEERGNVAILAPVIRLIRIY